MGLDMYLSAKLYLSEYSGEKTKDAFEKLRTLELPGITIPKPYIENYASVQLEVPVAYWRKANHIHQWFVNNCQDGNDDCGDYNVDIDKLRELDKLCEQVVMAGTPEYAKQYFPTAEGFFFGGDTYDDYYFEQTRETMDALHRLLADVKSGKLAGWDFYYHSSW